jgi:NAD(P)-dependent dehydrogenase (short-subunit alcohol dehydrogenase family)
MKSFEVVGKVALVSGANRGIGKAIVEALLEHGASKVYAAVRRISSLESLVERCGERVVPLEMDLTKGETISKAAQSARDVELLVNNAGVLRGAAPLAADALDALSFELDTNVFGLIRVAQAFAPVLKANGGGALVQLNSVASIQNFTDFTTYCASKAASYCVTQGLRDQLAAQGTLVVSVHPGPIATDMAGDAGMEDQAEPPEVVAEAIIEALATGSFHVFPDSYARQIAADYRSFAEAVIEADVAEHG